MHVLGLGLLDFRSYETLDLALEPGVTAFIGPNGQGKTNLVEAIGYASSQSSHRVAGDAPLVRQGCERALVRVDVARSDRTVTIEVEIVPGRANRARVNRAPATRTRDAVGILRTVLFAPDDLDIVKGDPSARRRFLDDLLVQRAPRYAGVRADFDRVLRQRNSLLKSAGAARRSTGVDETLDVWDEHLSATSADLLVGRLDLVESLAPRAAASYAAIAPEGGDLALEYSASWSGDAVVRDRDAIREQVAAALRARRREEIDRGVTLVGPQRDDVAMTIAGLPIRGYASHGESWSAALSLRLSSYDLLTDEAAAGDDPVLILDDVFAELDSSRRDHLASMVAGASQVLVTAAVPGDVPATLDGRRFSVSRGRVAPGA